MSTSAPKKRGRKAHAVEDRAVGGTIRLRPAEWLKFKALGGAEWLRARLRAAADPS